MNLRIVCVGAGWVTAHRHIPALRRDPRADVIGVVDVHSERAQAVASRHGLPHWGTDLDASWLRQAECAMVGTPPESHHAVVTALLERDLHVLCEKPIAMTPQDAESMVAMAEARRRVLAVVHNFQFSSAMLRARKLLDSGELGDLTSVYALQLSNPQRRLPSWYRALPGGLFYDEAPHLVYLLRSVLGDLQPAQSVAARLKWSGPTAEVRQLDVVFPHPDAWAQLIMNFDSPLSEWQFLLVGTRKLIAVDIFRDVSVLLANDGRHEARQVIGTTLRGVTEHLGGVIRSGVGHVSKRLLYGNVEVVRRFLDAVNAGGDPAGMSGRDGLAVVRVLHDLLKHAVA